MRLNRYRSKKEAVDCFYKHNKAELDAVLGRAYFSSAALLSHLVDDETLPVDADLAALQGICNFYLRSLRVVDATVAEFLANAAIDTVDLSRHPVSDTSQS